VAAGDDPELPEDDAPPAGALVTVVAPEFAEGVDVAVVVVDDEEVLGPAAGTDVVDEDKELDPPGIFVVVPADDPELPAEDATPPGTLVVIAADDPELLKEDAAPPGTLVAVIALDGTGAADVVAVVVDDEAVLEPAAGTDVVDVDKELEEGDPP
jgi:hypothetical protein